MIPTGDEISLRGSQSTPVCAPNAINTTVNGRPAYATNDLLQQHPRNSRLFRVYGRADDQLMLSTGEKTNPVPLGENHVLPSAYSMHY